jgi:hypothetical protein
LGAVNVQLVSDAAVTGGNNHRCSVYNKANVTDKAFVEDFVNQLAVVMPPRGKAL